MAERMKHTLMKYLYVHVRNYVIEQINNSIECGSPNLYIGILDLPGFGKHGMTVILFFQLVRKISLKESFEHNSLEQLCINYANEELQQFSMKRLIKKSESENPECYMDDSGSRDVIGEYMDDTNTMEHSLTK